MTIPTVHYSIPMKKTLFQKQIKGKRTFKFYKLEPDK